MAEGQRKSQRAIYSPQRLLRLGAPAACSTQCRLCRTRRPRLFTVSIQTTVDCCCVVWLLIRPDTFGGIAYLLFRLPKNSTTTTTKHTVTNAIHFDWSGHSSSDSTHHRLVSIVSSQVLELCPNEASKEVKQTMKEDGQNRSGAANPSHIYRGKKEVTMRGLCVCVNGPKALHARAYTIEQQRDKASAPTWPCICLYTQHSRGLYPQLQQQSAGEKTFAARNFHTISPAVSNRLAISARPTHARK